MVTFYYLHFISISTILLSDGFDLIIVHTKVYSRTSLLYVFMSVEVPQESESLPIHRDPRFVSVPLRLN